MTGDTGSALVLLLRHGRSSANAEGLLAGRIPGVGLDETGQGQAEGLVERLSGYRVSRIVSSPLERCRQTVGPLAANLGIVVEVDDRLAEVDYGDWSGRPLAELRDDPLWRTVQQHPAGMIFPHGETLRDAAARAVAAVRDQVAHTAPSDAVVLCSHGDLISAILADALGMHLDMFQRLMIGPASVSAIRYLPGRPVVEFVNETDPASRPTMPPVETVGGNSGIAASATTSPSPVA